MIIDKELPAFGDGVNATNVRLFTVTTDSLANAVPREWHGQLINIRCVIAATNSVHWFFSRNSAASVDRSLGATDAGASSAELGATLLPEEIARVYVPTAASNESVYLVREGSASGSLRVWPSGI
jgi:hypothetical protein